MGDGRYVCARWSFLPRDSWYVRSEAGTLVVDASFVESFICYPTTTSRHLLCLALLRCIDDRLLSRSRTLNKSALSNAE